MTSTKRSYHWARAHGLLGWVSICGGILQFSSTIIPFTLSTHLTLTELRSRTLVRSLSLAPPAFTHSELDSSFIEISSKPRLFQLHLLRLWNRETIRTHMLKRAHPGSSSIGVSEMFQSACT